MALFALTYGHQHIFDHIRSLAPPNYPWDWNDLVIQALNLDNRHLFQHVLGLVPSNYQLNWNEIVFKAKFSDQDFFDYIKSLVPTDYILTGFSILPWAPNGGLIDELENFPLDEPIE